MKTSVRTARHSAKGRRPGLSLISIVASLAMVLMGLVGLAAAPAASAVGTTPTCPSGYTLQGSDCVKTQTQPATFNPSYSCDSGWQADPTDASKCRKWVDGEWQTQNATKTTSYSCDAGWTPAPGNKCTRTTPTTYTKFNQSWHSEPDNCQAPTWIIWTDPSDGILKCAKVDSRQGGTETKNATRVDAYSCPAGWTPIANRKCTKQDDGKWIYKDADKGGTWSCPEGWSGPYSSRSEDDDQKVCRQVDKVEPTCATGTSLVGNTCIPNPPVDPKCSDDEVLVNHECVPVDPKCSDDEVLVNHECVPVDPKCTDDEVLVNHECVPVTPDCSKTEGGCPPTDNPTPPTVTTTQTGGDPCTIESCKTVFPTEAETPPAPQAVQAAQVEQPTQVSAPQEATVVPPAKPAVKPAKPAKKPVAAAVPAKATVPTAVPAGDGSSTPGVPMWALALIVIGALGAVGSAGKLIRSSR